jgi:hypothetical protein
VVTQVLVKNARPARPPGRLRGHGDDRAIAKLIQSDQTLPDPEPAADGARLGMQLLDQALLRPCRRARSTRRTRQLRSDKRLARFQKYIKADLTSLLPKLDDGDRPEHRHRIGHHAASPAPHRRVPARGARAAVRTCTSSRAIRRASACYGDLQPLREGRLGRTFVREMLLRDHAEARQSALEDHDGADFAYTMGVSRFRVNVLRHLNGLGGVMRSIPSKALTMDELNLPAAVRSCAAPTTA